MAVSRAIYGFEVGQGQGISGGGTFIQDGTARTGCFHGHTLLKTTGTTLFSLRVPTQMSLVAGETYVGVARLYARITEIPDANGRCIASLLSNLFDTLGVAVRINTDLTWTISAGGVTATPAGSPVLPFNQWMELTITCSFTRTGGALTGSVTFNGNTVGVVGSSGFSGGPGNFDRLDFGGIVVLNTGGGGTLGIVEWDDVVLIQTKTPDTGLAVLPAATRIRMVPITGQGASADWAGSFAGLQEIPFVAGGVTQTASAAGAATTFTHQTANQLGVAGVTAWHAYAYCTRPVGSSTEAIRINGVDIPATVTTSLGGNVTPNAMDWPAVPYTSTQFDATDYGVVDVTGAALTLQAFQAEILYTPTGTNWFLCGGTTLTGAPPFTGDPNAPPVVGCVDTFGNGTSSGGGSGCAPTLAAGADSGGGTGCQVTL